MKIKCCNCGSENCMPVEYGTVDKTMIKRIEKGEILHGGCAVSGLMQKYYCLDCDSRFDDLCTDLFMNHIRRIEYKHNNEVIEIAFSKEKLYLKTKEFDKEIDYSDDIKDQLRKTQVEYYQSVSPSSYQIRIECFGYIQDIVEKEGNMIEPVKAVLFQNWIEDLLKK